MSLSSLSTQNIEGVNPLQSNTFSDAPVEKEDANNAADVEEKQLSYQDSYRLKKYIKYGGYIITEKSHNEVSSLMGFFTVIATVCAFGVGMLLASFVAVSQREFASIANDNSNSLAKSLATVSGVGMIFGCGNIVMTSGAYLSLSMLNIPSDMDGALITWLNYLYPVMIISIVFLYGMIMAILYQLYY